MQNNIFRERIGMAVSDCKNIKKNIAKYRKLLEDRKGRKL